MVVLNKLHYLVVDPEKFQISKYGHNTRQRSSVSFC